MMEPVIKIEEKHFSNNYYCKRIYIDSEWVMDVDKVDIKDWLLETRREEIYDNLILMLKDTPTAEEHNVVDELVEEYYSDNKIMIYVNEHK